MNDFSLTKAILEIGLKLEEIKHRLAAQEACHAPATKADLHQLKIQIMSAISDFATKQNAFNDRIDTAVSDLQGDVQTLNDTIAKLQGTPGAITPEDQALLDAITSRASSIADKLDALDALTPPAPPTA